MKQCIEYTKTMLQAFEKSKGYDTTCTELATNGCDSKLDEEKFIHHLLLLRDECLIEGVPDPKNIGLHEVRGNRSSDGRLLSLTLSDAPIRMTSAGYLLLSSLNDNAVWSIIQKEAEKYPLGIIIPELVKVAAKVFQKKFK